MQENNNTTADRISKGITVIKSAIEKGDLKMLKECLALFAKLGATYQQLYEAVQDCPMTMAKEADITIPIHSEALGQTITLGKDITWDEIAKLSIANIRGESLKTLILARKEFDGTIESITPEAMAIEESLEKMILAKKEFDSAVESITPETPQPAPEQNTPAAEDTSEKTYMGEKQEYDQGPGLFPDETNC